MGVVRVKGVGRDKGRELQRERLRSHSKQKQVISYLLIYKFKE